jgi:hypothetical protein
MWGGRWFLSGIDIDGTLHLYQAVGCSILLGPDRRPCSFAGPVTT